MSILLQGFGRWKAYIIHIIHSYIQQLIFYTFSSGEPYTIYIHFYSIGSHICQMTTVTLFAQYCICKRIWSKMNQCWNMLFQETKTKYLNRFLFVWLCCFFPPDNNFKHLWSTKDFSVAMCYLYCLHFKLSENLQSVKNTNMKYISQWIFIHLCVYIKQKYR